MLKSIVSLWWLSLFVMSGLAQERPNNFPPELSSTTSISRTNSRNDRGSTTNTAAAGGGQTQVAADNVAASSRRGGTITTSATKSDQDGGAAGGGATRITSSAATASTRAVSASPTQDKDGSSQSQAQGSVTVLPIATSGNGGMSDSAKIGLGVGLGIGAALIAGAIALFFILRRRRSNNHYRSSGASAAYLREQPAMASGAPALAGMSEMGRSPSRHSFPHTPSQHSLVTIPDPPPEPKIIPAPQHSMARSPSFHSETASLQDRDSLMPTLLPYEDVPSPMEEHRHDEPVSPVSPISPAGSRPPSPLHDHER